MPASYAHYTFGSHVLSQISDISMKTLILEHHELFDIGLHGPDILFYYKPITSNHVTKTGYGLHEKIAADFFTHARTIIREMPIGSTDRESAMAYLFGFICHFTLDSECHGYVDDMAKVLGVSHTKIESEFERLLLEENHLNPILTQTTAHIATKDSYATCIAPFFEKTGVSDDITALEITHALKSFKFYSNLLLAPHKWERVLINIVLKLSGHYDFMHGLMISYKPEPRCHVTNEELSRRYHNAIAIAVQLLTNYNQSLSTSTPLSNRFQQDFK
ncbi:MAG: zinc dependent phospholipase C family protein [Lachnospiraceae bacterium]